MKGIMERERDVPETNRLVLGSGCSRVGAESDKGGGTKEDVVENSRLNPRGAATAALRAMT